MPPKLPSRAEIECTAEWIADHQRPDGGIPWFSDGRLDAWNHVQAAMALTVAGHYDAATTAYRHLAATQLPEGSWPSLATPKRVIDSARDTNHTAYLASGLWHYHLAHHNLDLLADMWPTLERAISFVLSHLRPDGVLHWAADPEGAVWEAPLLAGSSSAHGSLRCAARIAALLGHDRPEWPRAADLLARVLRGDLREFYETDLPRPVGHFGMDWYYPVLGGALRDDAGRSRLAEDHDFWVREGLGCRCVVDRPWFTVAETCELAIALDACGQRDRALEVFSWAHIRREESGGYWTGTVMVDGDGVVWPEEQPTWTAATVVLAADTLAGDSPTSAFFRNLDDGAWHHVVR